MTSGDKTPACVVRWRNAASEADASAALAEVYNYYFTPLFRYLRSITHPNASLVEDIIHDVFVILIKKREEIHLKSFGGLLKKIALRKAYDNLYRGSARKIISLDELLDGIGQEKSRLLALTDSQEARLLLQEFYNHPALTGAQKEVLFLALQGFTTKEIAYTLKRSERAIKKRKRTALRNLRALFAEGR